MSTEIQTEALDAARAIDGLTSSVGRLKAMQATLDASSHKKFMQSYKEMSRTQTEVINEMVTGLGSLKSAVEKMGSDIAEAATKAGKRLGDGLKSGVQQSGDSAVMTVRAQKAALQREYEELAALQSKAYGSLSLRDLASYADRNVRLKDLDAQRLTDHVNNLKAITKMEDEGFKASALSMEKNLQVSRLFDQAKQSLAEKAAASAAKSADAVIKAAEAETAALQAAALKNRDLNAAFSAMSPQAQLRRAQRVSVIATDEAGAAYASARYGSDALGVAQGPALATLKAEVESLANAKKTKLVPALDETKNKSNETSNALKVLATHSNDAHSAARGLASGFGAMWLTWGNIVPLLAGAGISHSFTQAVKAGSEFQHTMTTLGELSKASLSDVEDLSKAALDLGSNGPVGPQKVAEGMKALALAGLDAKEQLMAIKPVINFAIAGEMDLAKAAESVAAIGTAFGFSASGLSTVGDIIAKTAAISMASVSDMTEAFRQATVVAQQYGVSIKDASTVLALLSQVGIKGSAAGTALKNMYNELSGSSEKARKTLEKVLNVNIFDNAKKSVKDLSTIIADMGEGLNKLTFEGQIRALQAIGGEKGMKAISTVMTAAVEEANKAGESIGSAISRIREKLADAPGFVAEAAAAMSMTTKSEIETMWNALTAALIKSFSSVNPAIQSLTQSLADMFRSKEFESGLTNLISGIARFLETAWDWRKEILAVVEGLAVAGLAVAGFSATTLLVTTALPALSSALGFLGVALSGVALEATAALALLAPWVVAIGAVGFAIYKLKTATDEKDVAIKNTEDATKKMIKAMDDENERLQKQMDLQKEGVNVARAAAEAKSSIHREEMVKSQESQMAMAQERIAALKRDQVGTKGGVFNEYSNAIAQAEKDRNALSAQQARMLIDFDESRARLRSTAMEKARRDEKEADDKLKGSRVTGSKNFEMPEDHRARGMHSVASNELAEAKKVAAAKLAMEQEFADSKMALLREQAKVNTELQGAIQAEELNQLEINKQRRLETLQSSYEMESEAIRNNLIGLSNDYLKAIQANAGAKGEVEANSRALEDYNAKVQNLLRSQSTLTEVLEMQKKTTENSFETKKLIQLQALENEVRKVKKTFEDFWKAEDNASAKRARQTSLDDQLRYASPAAQAYLKAASDEHERLTTVIEGVQLKLDDATASYLAFTAAAMADGVVSEEEQKGLIQKAKLIEELAKQIDKLKAAQGKKVAEAGQQAQEKYYKDWFAGLEKGLSESIVTAMFEGGEKGAKSLRDMVVSEFRKEITITVNAVVHAGLQSIMGNIFGGGSGGGLMGGGGSGFNPMNLFSSGSNLATTISPTMGGGSAMGGVGGFMNGLSAWGEGGSVAGVFENASLYSGAELMGAAAPWALAAIAAISLLSPKSWETKFGGTYETAPTFGKDGKINKLYGPGTGGEFEDNFTQRFMNRNISSTDKMLFRLGSKERVAYYTAGAESSQEGEGFAFAGGRLTNGKTFGDTLGNGFKSNRGNKTPEQAMKDLEYEAQYAALAAVQAATDIPKNIADSLKDVKMSNGFKEVSTVVSQSVYDEMAAADKERFKKVSEAVIEYGAEGTQTLISEAQYAGTKMVEDISGIGTKEFKKLWDTVSFQMSVMDLPLANLKTVSKEAAQGLAELVGGFDSLNSLMSGFIDNFFTDAEKRTQHVKNITANLNAAGGNFTEDQIAHATRAQWRAAMDALDLSTEAGRKMYAAALMASAEFAGITDMINSATSVQGSPEYAAMTAARERLIAAYKKEESTLQSTIDRLRQFAKDILAFRDSLKLGNSSPLTPAQKYAEAQAQFQSTLALARGGDKDAMARLQTVSQAFLDASRVYNASNSTYTSDFDIVQQALTEMAGSATSQADAAQLQLDALKSQLSALGILDDSVKSVEQALHDFQAAVVALFNANGLPDLANIATQTGGKVNQWVGDYYLSSAGAGAIRGKDGNIELYTITGEHTSLQTAIDYVNQMVAKQDWHGIYAAAKKYGVGLASLDQMMGWPVNTAEDWAKANGLPTFAKGGSHSGGWAMVGEKGPELAYMPPARIYNAADTLSMMGGSAELVAEMRAIAAEIRAFREQQSEEVAASINSNYDAAFRSAEAIAQAQSKAAWNKAPELA